MDAELKSVLRELKTAGKGFGSDTTLGELKMADPDTELGHVTIGQLYRILKEVPSISPEDSDSVYLLKCVGKSTIVGGLTVKLAKEVVTKFMLQQGGKTVSTFVVRGACEVLEQVVKEGSEEVTKVAVRKAGDTVVSVAVPGACKLVKETVKEGGEEAAKRVVQQAGTETIAKTALKFVAGVAVEAVSCGYSIYQARQLYKAGKITEKEYKEHAENRVFGAAGSVAGSTAGAAVGSVLIPIPVVGTLVGSVVGGVLGDWLGQGTATAIRNA